MFSHCQSGLPVICIANAVDTLRETMFRAPTEQERYRIHSANFPQQDQATFWRPLDKLVISESPIVGFDWLCKFLGASQARNVCPENGCGSLFRDVTKDTTLQQAILDWCAEAGAFELIVHTSTPDLWPMVDFIRSQLGLRVELVESTPNQKLRDYLDTKTGFRTLATDLGLQDGPACIPPGESCDTRVQAVDAVLQQLDLGRHAIVKPDRGEASVGLNIFSPGTPITTVQTEIARNPYLGNDPIVVEEYVTGSNLSFPSIEYFIPAEGCGEPHLTYVCSMLFGKPTELLGNFVQPPQRQEAWFAPLVSAGNSIARAMQRAGYVGHFDIDTVIRGNEQALMLDLNPRRTGATHVHEFATAYLGPNYQQTHWVGAVDLYDVKPKSLGDMLETLGSYIRSPLTSAEGILPCELTGLAMGRISLLIWALSAESARSLRLAAENALRAASAIEASALAN